MRAWTDYPIEELGDEPGVKAPIRECDVLSYDGDKYCELAVGGVLTSVKRCYVYAQPGRCGQVRSLSTRALNELDRA